MAITIYHNPKCGTSRTCLQILEDAGVHPRIVEYLKTPLSRDQLEKLVVRTGGPVADIVRFKEPLASELNLSPQTPATELLDAMAAHPVLQNRPIVETDKGAKLCRPADLVHEIL
ncbi:MAG TPA: arsenate reductase (glutaredoxin) [Rhizomicrobium sp.]|nr:arsenate reductase (glutaredoxin) [Rhizomicrobium sp.]